MVKSSIASNEPLRSQRGATVTHKDQEKHLSNKKARRWRTQSFVHHGSFVIIGNRTTERRNQNTLFFSTTTKFVLLHVVNHSLSILIYYLNSPLSSCYSICQSSTNSLRHIFILFFPDDDCIDSRNVENKKGKNVLRSRCCLFFYFKVIALK